MDAKTYGWRTLALDIYVVGLLFALFLFFRSVYKTLRYREYNEAFPIAEQMLAAFLVLVGLAGNNLKSLPMWIYVISPTCVHYALLISYFVHQQVFNNRIRSIIKSRMFAFTTVASIVTVSIGLNAGDISLSFVNDESLALTSKYAIYYSLRSFISLYLEIATVLVILRNLHQHDNLAHIIRRYADLALFVALTATSFSVEINIAHILLNGGIYRHEINNIFFIGLGIAGVLIPVVLIPQEILILVLQPIQGYFANRKQRQLQYLHNRLTQVVKCVEYRHVDLYTRRMLIELEQAHYILWTHEPKIKPIKPRDTANFLFRCLKNDISYIKVGTCVPPPTYYDMDRHLLKAAKRLHQLERQAIPRTNHMFDFFIPTRRRRETR